MHIPGLIERKRDGGSLTAEEIAALIGGYVEGTVPDYQMAAWAMAVLWRGMDERETAALTRCMRDSGRIFEWPEGSPPKVDKHSTGGVGDKVSLVLAPLLACEGVWVPMISGRGLGFTGGTLDKLESIPGFRTRLTHGEMLAQLEATGCFIAGQTDDLVPADRKLYALRDVTGTVPSLPLITASIMSKKLAESLDRLVLDVKFGRGAFMKTRAEAEQLAAAMVSAGCDNGVDTRAQLNPMDTPLGRTVGNALEVGEAIDALQGRGPEDLVELTLDLAGSLTETSRESLRQRLHDGSAWNRFVRMVEAQGGDAASLEGLTELHRAPHRIPVEATKAGVLLQLDALLLGQYAVQLGAGRSRASDPVDYAVGLECLRKPGDHVEAGQPILMIHARTEPPPLPEGTIVVG